MRPREDPAAPPRVVQADAEGAAVTAARVRAGGVVLYPTETVYGLGCDPFAPEAVARIRALKGRDADKPMLALTDTWGRVGSWLSDVPDGARRLMAVEPAPSVTLLLLAAPGAPESLVGPGGLVGVRRVSDPFCMAVIANQESAIVSTSANPAGAPAPSRFADVAPEILAGVDVAVDAGRPLGGTPSTVVRFDGNRFIVVREGAVPEGALRRLVDA